MIGTAYRTDIPAPDLGETDAAFIAAVYPPVVFDRWQATSFVLVVSSLAVGDTQVLPCTRDGQVLHLLMLGHVAALDPAAAMQSAGYELEEVAPRAAA